MSTTEFGRYRGNTTYSGKVTMATATRTSTINHKYSTKGRYLESRSRSRYYCASKKSNTSTVSGNTKRREEKWRVRRAVPTIALCRRSVELVTLLADFLVRIPISRLCTHVRIKFGITQIDSKRRRSQDSGRVTYLMLLTAINHFSAPLASQ